ncbi:MAG: CDP-glycerol glycerophosphotransferase family protein [bacterium]|nr:CDP-glycerol glycerophosphotransferase family protein [bacterium]
MQQKTLFLSIYNGIRAKNFFHTDIYRELVKDSGVRMVIVVPSSKRDYYRATFPEENVIFESLDIVSEPWFGRLLAEIAFNSLGTITIRFKQKLEYWRYHKLLRYLLKRVINIILGPITPLRHVIRWLDGFVPINQEVAALLDRYKPDMVLAPDIVFPLDRIFLRAAHRKGYFVIGLTRSWDNLTSKGVIQILPDKLILHTERMKKQAIELVGMPEKDITVTGPPDYDKYFRPITMTKQDFCNQLGIPSDLRLILFAPFYDEYTGSAIIMINALLRAVRNKKLPPDVHFLIRYRPATPEIPDDMFEKSDHYTITKPCSMYFKVKNRAQAPTKDWEFSPQDAELLFDSIIFSDVMINTFSTIAIDAAAVDTPVIGVRFDADAQCPAKHSVVKIADAHDHYRELERTGGVRLVYNMEQLIQAINHYLEHPESDREGRIKMFQDQVGFRDGMNGKRTADFIREELFRIRN